MFRPPLLRLPSITPTLAGPSSVRCIGTFHPTATIHYPRTPPNVAAKKGGEGLDRLARQMDNKAEQQKLRKESSEEPKLRLFRADRPFAPWELSTESREFTQHHKKSMPRLGPPHKIAVQRDPFVLNGVDPLDEYQNVQLLREYMTETGRIMRRAQTGLTWNSQRRIGKAIRRAKAMGLMPVWSRPDNTNPGSKSKAALNR